MAASILPVSLCEPLPSMHGRLCCCPFYHCHDSSFWALTKLSLRFSTFFLFLCLREWRDSISWETQLGPVCYIPAMNCSVCVSLFSPMQHRIKRSIWCWCLKPGVVAHVPGPCPLLGWGLGLTTSSSLHSEFQDSLGAKVRRPCVQNWDVKWWSSEKFRRNYLLQCLTTISTCYLVLQSWPESLLCG